MRVPELTPVLEAACLSSKEAGYHRSRSSEVDCLNEQWAQSYVGFRLNDVLRSYYDVGDDYCFVTFETKVAWLDGYMGPSPRPGPRAGSLRSDQRFDVVVWSKDGRASGVVEIKDQNLSQTYYRTVDPIKIVGALRRWPMMRWGIFLFSVRASDRTETRAEICESIAERYERILADIRAECGSYVDRSDYLMEPSRGSRLAWAGVVFR